MTFEEKYLPCYTPLTDQISMNYNPRKLFQKNSIFQVFSPIHQEIVSVEVWCIQCDFCRLIYCVNPLNANPRKWSNTLKQFVSSQQIA